MSAVTFSQVSKKYRLGEGAYSTLAERVGQLVDRVRGSRPVSNPLAHELWALKEVSFDVDPGQALGIIGPNGAGKTTALKLVAGITYPTEGRITAEGRIAPLIQLGAGFHPELTGEENVYLNGSILGMERREIAEKFESIVHFAELQGFMDTPVKRYSSGMYARLGFSVAIHTEPQILLVDEVLAVGDWPFQQKCLKRMEQLKDRAVAIVFVSHNLDMVNRVCEHVILLHRGKVRASGEPGEVIGGYFDSIAEEKVERLKTGGRGARVESIHLLDARGRPANAFGAGEQVILRARVRFHARIERPEIGFFVRRPDRLLVMSTGSADLGVELGTVEEGEVLEIEFPFMANLLHGIYHIGVEIRSDGFRHYWDYQERTVTFTIHESYAHGGVTDLRPTCQVISRGGESHT